jgi:hypothetical protein
VLLPVVMSVGNVALPSSVSILEQVSVVLPPLKQNKLSVSCILYNQQDATCTMFFIIISALRVLGGFSAHHQELIKLYVRPWVLSCFPVVYCWCGWVVEC